MENLPPSSLIGIQLHECDSAAPRLTQARRCRGRELVVGRGVSVSYGLQPPKSSRKHCHEHVQIAVALDPVEAVLSWRSKGRWEERKVSGRHGWLVPSGVTHMARRLGDGRVMVLYIEPRYVREICETDFKEVGILDITAIERSDLLVWQLTHAFGELCRCPDAASPLFVESLGTALATQLVRAHLGENNHLGARRTGLSGERLKRIMAHIESNLAGDLSRGTLAAVANLSLGHFSRGFKISTGHAPHEYVMSRRQIYARELLKDGRMKKSAVAAEAGFSDQTHLGRHLKKPCLPPASLGVEERTIVLQRKSRPS